MTGRKQRNVCVLLLLACGSSLWAQGYSLTPRVDPDQVVVNRARHWEEWTIPTHLVDIDRGGTVRLREFRPVHELLHDDTFGRSVTLTQDKPRISNMDSILKRDLYGGIVRDPNSGDRLYDHVVRPGVSRVGSNPDEAWKIFDGVDSTYWEPNFEDPLEDWWIEVDMGRPVPLQRLLMHFVEEGRGDPFYRYILVLGPAQLNHVTPIPDQNATELFIPFEGVNTEQRTFVFDAERVIDDLPSDPRVSAKRLPVSDIIKTNSKHAGVPEPSPDWDGKLVEVIRIVVTDTRGGRAELISEARWDSLKDAGQGEEGDVVHFLKDGDFEEPVDEDTYSDLPESRQGGRVHYRRELPRLGEVYAWARGDDIAGEIVSGGGVMIFTGAAGPDAVFDGNYTTTLKMETFIPTKPDLNIMDIDIGGSLWLDEVRTISQNPPRGYLMRSSKGALDAQGNRQWERLSSVERETNADNGFYRQITDVLDPPRRVRFLDMRTFLLEDKRFTTSSRVLPNLREMWLFTEGPPAEVELVSDMIELPGLFALGAVRWEGEEPPGSEVEIRTRTGDQLLTRILYCDNVGDCNPDRDEKAWKRLGFSRQGPIDTSNVVGPGWSPWSRKYENSGDQATSPGLRRFMQIQVRLINHDRQAIPGVKEISVDLLKPIAQQLGAEVWPDLTQAGRPDTFEVFVQPHFLVQPSDSRSPGFDEVLLKGSPAIDLRLVDVALGTEEELAVGEPAQSFDRWAVDADGDSVLLDAEDNPLRLMSRPDPLTGRLDSLWLQLPDAVNSVPASVLPRTYFRQVEPGDEVPTTLDGRLLTVHSWSLLPIAPINEKGSVRYFRLRSNGRLLEVGSVADYDELPEEEKGPVRYFRTVTGLGEQTVFDDDGDSLTTARRGADAGWTVGSGRLLRLRFASTVYLPSTQLEVAVRNTGEETPWQGAGVQDVTTLGPAGSLTIQTEGTRDTVGDIDIAPNPFTPNLDTVNDEARISFSLLQVAAPRSVIVQIYSLGGDPVRRLEQLLVGGPQAVDWDGRDDAGDLVAPGLYLCQIGVSADTDAGRQKHTRVIAVAY